MSKAKIEELVRKYLEDKKTVVEVLTEWERLGLTRREFCERLYDDHSQRSPNLLGRILVSGRVVVIDVVSQSYEVHQNDYSAGFCDPDRESSSWRRYPGSYHPLNQISLGLIKRAIEIAEKDLGKDLLRGDVIGFDGSYHDGGSMRFMVAYPDPGHEREMHVSAMLKSLNSLYTRTFQGKSGLEAKKAQKRLEDIEKVKRELYEEEKKLRKKLLKGRIESGQERSGESVREGEEVVEADAGKG